MYEIEVRHKNKELMKLDNENRLSIINTHLDKLVFEVEGIYQRDLVLDCQKLIKQLIWCSKKDKEFHKEHPLWKSKGKW